MIYISKGMEVKGSTKSLVKIHSFTGMYELNGQKAMLWKRGRQDFATVYTIEEERALFELKKEHLVEFTESQDMRTRYFLLFRCILYVPKKSRIGFLTNTYDRRIFYWLKKAGYRLDIGELIYLMEHKVQPSKLLLGEEQGGRLYRTIHVRQLEIGRDFELRMSVARCREEVVDSVIRLVQQRKIYLI